MGKKEFTSKSPSETWKIGERIGKGAKRGELYAIIGELGAGKTQLVKGIAKGMGVEDWLYVVSPSFTIMNIYEGKDANLCHVDLYRIDGSEFEPLGIDEFLGEGVVAVEWADRVDWWDGIIQVNIEIVGEEERRITVITT
jgi:tRNA threonylcarbamoyladenosine biosynthesis protein TsaE